MFAQIYPKFLFMAWHIDISNFFLSSQLERFFGTRTCQQHLRPPPRTEWLPRSRNTSATLHRTLNTLQNFTARLKSVRAHFNHRRVFFDRLFFDFPVLLFIIEPLLGHKEKIVLQLADTKTKTCTAHENSANSFKQTYDRTVLGSQFWQLSPAFHQRLNSIAVRHSYEPSPPPES